MKIDLDVKTHLVKTGYDPLFGARPLKRAIINEIENPLANQLLSNKFKSGDTIKISIVNDKIVFTK